MWEILANYLLPKASKSYPYSNKSPNLVTLGVTQPLDKVNFNQPTGRSKYFAQATFITLA